MPKKKAASPAAKAAARNTASAPSHPGPGANADALAEKAAATNALVASIPLHLFAYHFAKARDSLGLGYGGAFPER